MTTPSQLAEVEVAPLDPARLEPFVGAERMAALLAAAARSRETLAGRTIVNVNSTAAGGGVAEMLYPLLGYARGVGIATRWLLLRGDPDFFAITKRIHNGLYGGAGDGGELGEAERAAYERTIAANSALLDAVRPGDVWVVHDPQPAGLVPALRRAGATVVWRCHVGRDTPNEYTERSWAFVRPYVEEAHAYVFSREAFAPDWVDRALLHVIAPSIDPFTAKNAPLDGTAVPNILAASGLVAGELGPRPAHVIRDGPPPDLDVPLVVQVSRWDPMKDMAGVLDAFAEHVPVGHLVLAGPQAEGVADDPEAALTLADTRTRWEALPEATRRRVHLAELPMDDVTENATIVNALQRHAAVVTQKSLAEGFGLTVVEAMLKARPVVASAVGGIVDQIVDGESGLLVRDPADLASFGRAVSSVVEDPELAARLAENAQRRASERYLADRHLLQYAGLLGRLLSGPQAGGGPPSP
jgi:trehalose synthase